MNTSLVSNPDFPKLEKEILESWNKKDIVRKYLSKNNAAHKTFSYLDGPITANNPMGVHHAWGRTYKDLFRRFYNLCGYRQTFHNGFDCQGLWVEVEVEKELKLRSKRDIENLVPGNKKASIAKFVQLCKDRVYKYASIQTDQSKRLGYFADWDNSYFTMDPDNNFIIWHFLKTCHEHGWIYKGHESVPWCPRCETAISQHEMLTEDYKEVVHESVFIEFPLVQKSNKNSTSGKEYLLVWTTTPWTIPANIAVAVDEKIEYSLVEGTTGNTYWIAKDLVIQVFKGEYKKVIKTVKGKELIGLTYEGPFDHFPAVAKVKKENPKTFHTVIRTDPFIMPISTTEGTGLVHTAVSAGTEDFMLGKKLGLPMIPVIADDARYLEGFGEFSGKNAKKHPELIIDFLGSYQKGEFLFATLRYKHRYPACWRCKAELVWKVADEWYIAMDKPSQSQKFKGKSKNSTLRQRMIEVAKQIKWMPEFGLERELDWLNNMHDWLISKKNRYWGLALPIYECSDCGTFDVLGSEEELKSKSVSGWDQLEGKTPHKPFIDEVKISCKTCKKSISRIDDVGNPWLDAGIVAFSTIKENNKGEPLYLTNKKKWMEFFPADFISESFPGQFKNWFYSLIAMSTVLENTPPFKTVLGYGTLFGEDGRAMHKSWGNSIEFNEGADKIGVDVMRWLYARQNPADNMLFGYKKSDEVRRQFYLMFWNIFKFYSDYSTLEKIHPVIIDISKSFGFCNNILDQWILHRLVQVVKLFETNLTRYNAKDAVLSGEEFVHDISTWFIRRSRDRIWVNSEDHDDKVVFYNVLHTILVTLSVIFSPVIPFLTDYIFTQLTSEESVHLATWPRISTSIIDKNIITDMQKLREIVEVGHRVRKELKIKLKQPLASVELSLTPDFFSDKNRLGAYKKLLSQELNVKEVKIKAGELQVTYDTFLTADLKHEGKRRELIREIQEQRKQLGIKPDSPITLVLPKEFEQDGDFISKRVLAHTFTFGKKLQVS